MKKLIQVILSVIIFTYILPSEFSAWFLLNVNWYVSVLIDGCDNDMACLIRASEDRQGLDAIRALHQQLDDDANGAVDLSESNDVRKVFKNFTKLILCRNMVTVSTLSLETKMRQYICFRISK